MNQLSSGVIADIIEGGHPDKPLVQILSMKRILIGSQERWRLLVSDSRWSCNFTMLATHLSNKVSSGKITNYCIIRLDRYVCNMIQDNKKVLIILDLTVTKSGEEVGGTIGEPVLYNVNKTCVQQQPVTKPPPPQNQTYANKPINNNNMAGSGWTLHQNGPGQRNLAATGSSQAKTTSGGNVHPIASLTPYQNRKGILLSAATTSPPSLRDGEEVSFTVEEGRKGVEATNVAGLDGGKVLGSLHTRVRKTTDQQPPQQQQADIVTVCTKTAVALAAVGLGRLSDLLQDIFERNGLPPIAISPDLQPPNTTTTKKQGRKNARGKRRADAPPSLFPAHPRRRLMLPHPLNRADGGRAPPPSLPVPPQEMETKMKAEPPSPPPPP